MKEVQFQFKKKQSERAMTAIQNSYAFKKQQINAESWRELHVFDPNVRLLDPITSTVLTKLPLFTIVILCLQTEAAQDEFEHLFSEREEEVILEVSRSEYLKALRYRDLVTCHE
jgi:DNA-directed RNA polymerase-3 subunit RPC5